MSIYKFISVVSIFTFSLLFSQDVLLSLDGSSLNYESSEDVAGFQFTHDGCVSGASGGDAAANGFTLSSSGSTVLAFSFTGAVIPSGSGTLLELAGNISSDCLSDFIFSNSIGEALDVSFDDGSADDGGSTDGGGDWGGDACSMPINTLHLDSDGNVLYNSSSDVGGFQFNVDGATVNDASGGDAASAGFLISTSATTVLGFSLTGGTIPSGCGTLLELDLEGAATGLSGIVMSDPAGSALDFEYFPMILLFVSVMNDFDFNDVGLKYFSFNFSYILIFYYTLRRKEALGYISLFVAGLFNDVIVGLPMGISSLLFLLICGFASYLRNITIRPSPIKDWFYFLFIVSLINSINYSILTLFFSFDLILMSYLVNTFFTFLFYIFFVSIFKYYLKSLND